MLRWGKKKHGVSDTGGVTDGVTPRYTVHLPTGQKAVVRSSPRATLRDLVLVACQERGLDLDLNRYLLQPPKKPGIALPPDATLEVLGLQEVHIVPRALPDKNHTVSLPDLSKLPPSGKEPQNFNMPHGLQKKRRGFLSFLGGKKDKKYKTESRRSLDGHSSSTLSLHTPVTPELNTPVTPELNTPVPVTSAANSPGSSDTPELNSPSSSANPTDARLPTTRPRSMFLTSDFRSASDQLHPQFSSHSLPRSRKSRRAPDPPVSSISEISESQENEAADNILQNSTSALTDRLQEQTDTAISNSSAASQSEGGKIQASLSQDSGQRESPSLRIAEDNNSQADNYNAIASHSISSPSSDNTTLESKSPDISSIVTTQIGSCAVTQNEVPCNPTLPRSVSPISSNLQRDPEVNGHNVMTSLDEVDSVIKLENFKDDAEAVENLSAGNLSLDENKPVDFNSILDGIVLEEEIWPTDLSLALRAEAGRKDSAMMVETSSVISENIDQLESSTNLNRICAFIPPPPPLDPPPWDPPSSVDLLESMPITSTPILVDKSTGVTDENSSLASSSTNNSPSHGFYYNVGMSIDVKNQHIPGGSEAVYPEVSKRAHTLDPLQDISLNYHEFENEVYNVDVSDDMFNALINIPPPPGFDDNSVVDDRVDDTRVDDRDTNAESTHSEEDDEEQWSTEIEELVIPYGPNGYDFGAARKKIDRDKIAVTPMVVSGINDRQESHSVKISSVSAKQDKVSSPRAFAETETQPSLTSTAQTVDSGKRVVTLDSMKPVETTDSMKRLVTVDSMKPVVTVDTTKPVVTSTSETDHSVKPLPLSPASIEPMKEQFVLTSEDLSGVSLSPRSSLATFYQETQWGVKVSPVSLVAQKPNHAPSTNALSNNVPSIFQHAPSTLHHTYEPQPQPTVNSLHSSYSAMPKESHIIEKPRIPPKFPKTIASRDSTISPSLTHLKDSQSNDPVATKSKPHLLLMKSQTTAPKKTAAADVYVGGTSDNLIGSSDLNLSQSGADTELLTDHLEQLSHSTAACNSDSQDPTLQLHQQYLALQGQLHHWQEQLVWNQSILASQAVGSELATDQLVQLTEQIAVHQQMALELESTVQALKQKQQGSDGVSIERHVAGTGNQPVAGASEPTFQLGTDPPSQPTTPLQMIEKPKAPKSTPKRRPKLDRELGPREQLMISIKSYSRKNLKSVPVEMTRWSPCAL